MSNLSEKIPNCCFKKSIKTQKTNTNQIRRKYGPNTTQIWSKK